MVAGISTHGVTAASRGTRSIQSGGQRPRYAFCNGNRMASANYSFSVTFGSWIVMSFDVL